MDSSVQEKSDSTIEKTVQFAWKTQWALRYSPMQSQGTICELTNRSGLSLWVRSSLALQKYILRNREIKCFEKSKLRRRQIFTSFSSPLNPVPPVSPSVLWQNTYCVPLLLCSNLQWITWISPLVTNSNSTQPSCYPSPELQQAFLGTCQPNKTSKAAKQISGFHFLSSQ